MNVVDSPMGYLTKLPLFFKCPGVFAVLESTSSAINSVRKNKYIYQARNQLGIPGVAKSFLRGPKFFKLCPIVFNYAQQIFPGEARSFVGGGFAALVTGLLSISISKLIYFK